MGIIKLKCQRSLKIALNSTSFNNYIIYGKEIKKIFEAADRDGNGALDSEEWPRFLRMCAVANDICPDQMSKGANKKFAKALFEKFDANHDGKVTWSECWNALNAVQHLRKVKAPKKAAAKKAAPAKKAAKKVVKKVAKKVVKKVVKKAAKKVVKKVAKKSIKKVAKK